MRILIIGGTRFVGRHIAATALAAGHEVTLLHRGRTGGDLFDGTARHLLADRDDPDALAATLARGEWDATIDVCAYLPGQVSTLADALGVRGGRYVLISTVSVYDPEGPAFTENSRLRELDGPTPTEVGEVTYANYGGLKVLCEQVAADRFGADVLVLRPSYVIGPWDHFGHVDYWAHRIARGGEILAPAAPSTPLQVIDARDIADFTFEALAEGRSGTLHLVGASATYTYADFLDEVRAGIGVAESTVTWVDDEFLLTGGETVASLPMWAQGDRAEELINTADPAASLRAGLRLRPVAEAAREALASGPRRRGRCPPNGRPSCWPGGTRAEGRPGPGLTPVRDRRVALGRLGCLWPSRPVKPEDTIRRRRRAGRPHRPGHSHDNARHVDPPTPPTTSASLPPTRAAATIRSHKRAGYCLPSGDGCPGTVPLMFVSRYGSAC